MSDYDYNALLTPGVWRGKCGQREILESPARVRTKSEELATLVRSAKHVVVFTGAGISTSSGIPDFRGPKGVWTLESASSKDKRRTSPRQEVSPPSVGFQDAKPSPTHMALVAMVQAGIVQCVISQNVDGLHMASGIPRDKLSELHGNVFMICCENVRAP